MHKTLLATLVIGASALAIPAFAQVNLSGAARVGAGVNTGAIAPNAMHTAGQIGNQTDETLQHTTHRAKHVVHQTAGQTSSTIGSSGGANASVNGGGAMSAGAGNNSAAAYAGIDAGGTVNRMGQAGQNLGNRAGNTVRSVGNVAGHATAGQSVGADANVNANADAHGH